jgi:hypothetical protein
MVLYEYTTQKEMHTIPLEDMVQIFERNGFIVNIEDSRKKGRWQGEKGQWEDTVAYTKLDRQMMEPYGVCGYDLIGEGFLARIDGNMIQMIAGKNDTGRIKRLKEELEGYG